MERTPRVLGLLASGGVLVATHVMCYQRAHHDEFGIMDLLHFSFPLTIYVLANLLIDEGRARERESARAATRADPGR
jgi:hypothetical protein